jgi:hypothetical protein
MGETEGFLKALIGDDDRILGFTALGVGPGNCWRLFTSQWPLGCPTCHFLA